LITVSTLFLMDHGYGPGGDLFLALEQLEAIRDLLLANSPVKDRMALILLDALADALLFRRLEQIYEATEEPFRRHKMPRFSRQDRFAARQRFNRRVEIARQATELDRWVGEGEELISESDAAILKVGHSYRNGAYHEGALNPDVTAALARVLFGAVARLVARSERPGVAVGSISERRISQLAGWGYKTGGMLELRPAADAVSQRFTSELAVDATDLGGLLADDLEARVESLRSDVGFLAESGVEPEKIIEGIELWSHYGADEELLELQAQFDPFAICEASERGELREDVAAEAEAALKRYRERQEELEREHKRRVSLDLLDRATSTAERLRTMSDTKKVLVAYHDVERPLAELEDYVDEAVRALDREIQRQIDLARGK
jgi:hypothetical protein